MKEYVIESVDLLFYVFLARYHEHLRMVEFGFIIFDGNDAALKALKNYVK